MARRPSRVEAPASLAPGPAGHGSTRAPGKKPAVKKIPVSARLLEAENIRLTQELSAARAEIAALKKRQTEIANRLDWVIDSLHSLLGEGG